MPKEEYEGILIHCHDSACGGHFASQKTTMKVLHSGIHCLRMPTPCASNVISAKGWETFPVVT